MSEFTPVVLTNADGDTRRANTVADQVRFEFDGFKAAPAKKAKAADAKAPDAKV